MLTVRAALEDCLRLLEWDGEYDEAMRWRDWQTCDLLLDARGRSPLRDKVIAQARATLGGNPDASVAGGCA